MLFPEVLPSSSTVQSDLVLIPEEGCLHIEVTTRLYDAGKAIGGLSLYIKLDDDNSDGALIFHKDKESQQVTTAYEVDMPEGVYPLVLTAKGNMFSELGIDSLHLQPGHCHSPSK